MFVYIIFIVVIKTIKWDFFPICYRKDSHDINVITEITKLC